MSGSHQDFRDGCSACLLGIKTQRLLVNPASLPVLSVIPRNAVIGDFPDPFTILGHALKGWFHLFKLDRRVGGLHVSGQQGSTPASPFGRSLGPAQWWVPDFTTGPLDAPNRQKSTLLFASGLRGF